MIPPAGGDEIKVQTSAQKQGRAIGPPEKAPFANRDLGWVRRDSILLLAILVVAALIRFVRLDQPPSLVFDETYYAKDACLYTGHSQKFCGSPYPTEISWVHPPLGKWIIASGIKLFGFNPFGWRSMAAVFGTALAGLVFLLARRLFKNRWIAGVAGLLTATDFLLIVQSRVAMLDIFEAFFVVIGFFFLAIDRERVLLVREHARLPFPGDPPRRMFEWRLLAGAAFGAAVGVKWQAIWGLLAGAAIAVFWSAGLWRLGRTGRGDATGSGDLTGSRDTGSRLNEKASPTLRRELAATCLAFVLVPTLVYMLAYTSWFADNYPHRCQEGQVQRIFLLNSTVSCREGALGTVLAFSDLQSGMLDFHAHLNAKHPYQSPARTWPLVVRPIAYYYEGEPQSAHILAFGNPATWWLALAAAAWLLVRSVRRWRPERVVVAGWAGQYLPWLLPFIHRPAIFLFYMTPIVPFMMTGLAAALGAFRELGRPARWAVVLYLVLGVGVLFWYFYPIIGAVGIPYEWWRNRMWFSRWI